MKDPIRWSDEGGSVDSLELEVLRSDRGMAPTANESATVWSKLAGELGLASGLLNVTTAAALGHAAGADAGVGALTNAKTLVPSTSGSVAFIKGVVVGVVACGAIWGGAQLLGGPAGASGTRSPPAVAIPSVGNRASAIEARVIQMPREERATASATSAAASSPQGSRERARLAPDAQIAEAIPAPSVARFGELVEVPNAAAQQHDSELQQEALLLRQARQQLRTGELLSAYRSLEEARLRFPAPKLQQEREALTIELLFLRGEKSAAAERARKFLSTFPESPHASRVKTFTVP
jgi:hypothetical protein